MSPTGWVELFGELTSCDDFVAFAGLLRQAERIEEATGPPPVLHALRLAVLGGGSTELLTPALRLALRARGLEPELHEAPFGVIMPELLDPLSATTSSKPDLAVVLPTAHEIPNRPPPGCGREEADALADESSRYFIDAGVKLHERCGCEIVLANFASLPSEPFGQLAAKTPESDRNFLRRVNLRLGDLAPAFIHILDVAGLAERIGLETWFDSRLWYLGRQSVAPMAIPSFVSALAGIIAAARGRARRCLVVDLDGTLWGGVIGDDGIDGIELGEGSPLGEAHQAFQRYLRRLADRGVLLAVCSKNDDGPAREPFRSHPHRELELEDFVSFHAGWRPKSDVIRDIADELGLGLESFVFLDDDAAQREQVRQALPAVAVPEPGEDPTSFIDCLERGRFFEAVALTEEDRHRRESYRLRSKSTPPRDGDTDLAEFLSSLAMRAELGPFGERDFDRVTQLANKTNQFNLTTQRLTRGEVDAMANAPDRWTLAVRLLDRFGNHGLISAVYGTIRQKVLVIDGWFMSCRVLQRGVESFVMNHIVVQARANGWREVHGSYRASQRNGLVAEHYPRLGFEPLGSSEGATQWSLTVANHVLITNCIEEAKRRDTGQSPPPD